MRNDGSNCGRFIIELPYENSPICIKGCNKLADLQNATT